MRIGAADGQDIAARSARHTLLDPRRGFLDEAVEEVHGEFTSAAQKGRVCAGHAFGLLKCITMRSTEALARKCARDLIRETLSVDDGNDTVIAIEHVTPEAILIAAEQRRQVELDIECLRRAVDALQHPDSFIVTCRMRDLSFAEIAAALNIKANAARQRFMRARLALIRSMHAYRETFETTSKDGG
jgi:hypothetical protein